MDRTYSPAIFEPPDTASARQVILTTEGELGTDARWARETPCLAERLGGALDWKPGQVVVDCGGGEGRMYAPLSAAPSRAGPRPA